MNKRALLWLAGFVAVGLILVATGAFDFLLNGGSSGGDSASMDDMPVYRSGPFQVSVSVNPETPKVGDNRLMLKVMDGDGRPVPDAQIQAYGQMPAMGAMQAMRAPADLKETAPGVYEGTMNLEMSGSWPLSIQIEKPGSGTANLGFDMATGRQGLELTTGGSQVKSAGGAMDSGSEHEAMSAPQMDENGLVTTGNYRIAVTLHPDAAEMGMKRLVVHVGDSQENAITGARVRAIAQLEKGYGKAAKANVEIGLRATEPGQYAGSFRLPSGGPWVLAVDVGTEKLGHADLVFEVADGADDTLKLVTTTPEGIAYYTCSMHTSVRAAGPGQCPICSMDLVPVTQEEVQTGAITVDDRRRQLIGLELGEAKMADMNSTIRAVGRIAMDETRLSDVSLRFDAWIGEIKADYVGKEVKQGEVLFTVYGPNLLAAQQEFLQVTKRRAGRSDGLIAAAHKRLSLWGLTQGQIAQLKQRGEPLDYVPILAPRSGTVIEKNIVIGTANQAGMTLMRIADLSRVWVEADIYESELALVKPGMQADITLPYLQGQTYRAKVDYVYPYLMGDTRTGRVRLVLDNADAALKPEMYAEVTLRTNLGERLAVPEQAVLFAGDARVVFIDLGEGRLKPVKIRTGARTKDLIEVLEGLKPGDRVVTSGNFLIAAESRLKSGIEQW